MDSMKWNTNTMEPMLLFLAFVISVFLLKRWKQSIQHTLPLPPGPKSYPLIGNLLQIPSATPWKTFRDWSKLYGDVICFNLPGQRIVVLNSAEAAIDLLEKRSDIYSDRPVLLMHRLIYWDWGLGLIPYSQRWRVHRREFHQFFNQHEATKYLPIQLRECRAFLRRGLDSPGDLQQNVRQTFTAIILKITYDMDVTKMDDEYVRLAQDAVEGLCAVTVPQGFIVEYIPILRHLPEWFPGFQFNKVIGRYKPIIEKMRNQPFDKIQRDMRDGKAIDSLTSSLIERLQQRSGATSLSPEEDELARNVAGVAYSAAADTTTTAALSFLIAMSMYPDVQRKAQNELDRVIGNHRLPDFGDPDDLIYIQAVALEAMRWMVVVPLGIAHRVTSDDEYKGFYIPKGTTVIANSWAMLHNPEDYPEPSSFKPERYIKDGKLNPAVRDPLALAFGFGRRICPGRHLSSASLFMFIASVLHVYDIRAITREGGKMFDPLSSVGSGLVAAPYEVPCELMPRSEGSKRLIDVSI